MTEPPSAGDLHHRVYGRIGGLQIAVRAVEAHPTQVLQRRRSKVATKRVLHRARGDVDRRGNVVHPDISVGVVVNERDCPAQRLRLRGRRFDTVRH
jgi:hypothetical protein